MGALVALVSLLNASAASAIVGGQNASAGEYPWQARLWTVEGGQLCGGALLNTEWVLTAAHCFRAHSYEEVKVTLGDHRQYQADASEQTRDIDLYYPHPDFDTAFRNDIALIRLSSPVTFSSAIQPIDLAYGDYDAGTSMSISGWGLLATNNPNEPDVLQEAQIPTRSNETCDDTHTWMTMTGSMMCGGTPGTSGVSSGCFGDSGGPLVVDDPQHGKRLVGLFSQGSSTCQHYSVATRVRDFVPWIEGTIGFRPPVCSGRTAPGNTVWTQHDSDTITTEIDTRACDWPATPLYFTTLGGTSTTATTTGATSIYDATAKKFRVYVNQGGITPALADSGRWHINWVSVANNEDEPEVCSGRSATNTWVQYNANAIYMDVNTTACGFSTPPAYFTSLSGTGSHSTVLGTNSIYSATATGFRIYIHKSGVTPTYASDRSWRILWRAEPASVSYADVCNGRTTMGSTSWQQGSGFYGDSVYVDVDVSGCDLSTASKFFTMLGGWSQHFTTEGATSIYSPNWYGFRVYVYKNGITPNEANDRRWHIVWNARP